jgi:hypothetical protein
VADTREDVLARLLEIAASIPNIKSAQRNNVDITAEQLPAAIVFDGSEETDDANDKGMRPAHRPTVVRMTPAILIAEKSSGQVGTDLDTLRREIVKLVLTDTELNEQIVKTGRHGNGAIRYLGCETDLGWMASLHGAMQVNFLFKYAMKPEDL